MGKRSRDKGARGEREAIALLQPIVDKVTDELGQPKFELERNTKQRYAPKQYDLIGVPWVALEIKRVENLSGLNGWWKQTLAATGEGQVPVLMYRQNHGKWQVRLRVKVLAREARILSTINVDIETFKVWFEWMLRGSLRPLE